MQYGWIAKIKWGEWEGMVIVSEKERESEDNSLKMA
jgi:hypothetical protein